MREEIFRSGRLPAAVPGRYACDRARQRQPTACRAMSERRTPVALIASPLRGGWRLLRQQPERARPATAVWRRQGQRPRSRRGAGAWRPSPSRRTSRSATAGTPSRAGGLKPPSPHRHRSYRHAHPSNTPASTRTRLPSHTAGGAIANRDFRTAQVKKLAGQPGPLLPRPARR